MRHTVVIEKPAEKFIMRLARPEKEWILKAIHELPDKGDIKRLQGKKSQGMYRLRVGSYRIIFTVDNGRLVECVVGAGTSARLS